MALQTRSLQQAQQQLEEVRQNRQRADEDVEVRPGLAEAGSWWREHINGQALEPSCHPWLSHAGCVTLGKLPNLSEFQVPRLGKRTGYIAL